MSVYLKSLKLCGSAERYGSVEYINIVVIASAGQGVVQFGYCKGVHEQVPIATKFFLKLSDYREEAHFYTQYSDALGGFMPKIFLMHDNADGAVTDPFGNVLPPFIVMEKGEPLPTLASQVDIMACTQVCCLHVCVGLHVPHFMFSW